MGRTDAVKTFEKGVNKYLNDAGVTPGAEWLTQKIKESDITPIVEVLNNLK